MTRVLISGAGIAGTVLAYWLSRHGTDVTVVEKATDIRRTGGHALDLSGVATEVMERMGVLPALTDARVQRDRVEFRRRGGQPVTMSQLSTHIADRHVEIQRDVLLAILHDATTADAEFIHGDSVAALTDGPTGVRVEFERAAPDTYDLVIGADGLHSRVRGIAIGPEEQFRHDLGAHLAVYSYPNDGGLDREVVAQVDVDRSAFTYAVDDGERARALLLFRGAAPEGDPRDRAQQLLFVRRAFAGLEPYLSFPLDGMERADDFYFDSISQIRMDRWSRGRVAVIGDAAHSTGPAVGGGTALAVLGAYVLANEIALAGGDHERAYANTERIMRDPVDQGRKLAPSSLAQLVPRNRLDVSITPHLLKLITRLPQPAARALFALKGSDRRTLDEFSSAVDVT